MRPMGTARCPRHMATSRGRRPAGFRNGAGIILAGALTMALMQPASAAHSVWRSPGGTGGAKKLWVARYDNPVQGDNADDAVALAPSPDGSMVFVTGSSYGSGTRQDYATVAYDTRSGDQVWVARYDGPGNDVDLPAAIAVSPDGSAVFVTGRSMGSNELFNYATVAYAAASGQRLWHARYGQDGSASALGVSPDGSAVFVTGTDVGLTGDQAYATVTYDARSGQRLWARRYHSAHGYAIGTALGVAPDGSKVFVSGSSIESTSGLVYTTVAYRATDGKPLWVSHYVGPCSARACNDSNVIGLVVGPNGAEVYVSGWAFDKGGRDFVTVAYRASDGATTWVSRFAPGGIYNYVSAVVVSPDSSTVFVTGETPSNGFFDYVTVAYDASAGDQRWVSRYDGPLHGEDYPLAAAPLPDGSAVVVTGASQGLGTYEDYATVAYRASTGEELWVKRYDGPASRPDFATGLGSGPNDTRLFVTGMSYNGSNYDYATIAYSLQVP